MPACRGLAEQRDVEHSEELGEDRDDVDAHAATLLGVAVVRRRMPPLGGIRVGLGGGIRVVASSAQLLEETGAEASR